MAGRKYSQNRFIRHLVRKRLVPLHRINLAFHEQKRVGGTLAANLLYRGYISEDDLNRAIAATMDIPYIELVPEKLDRRTIEMVPPEILTEYLAVPLYREGRELHVALDDPTDHRALNDLSIFSKSVIKPAVASRESLLFVLDYYFAARQGSLLGNYRLADYSPPPDLPYEEIVRDTTAATLVYTHLLEARRKGVREIHFEPVERGLRVRYRIGFGMEERVLYPPVFRKTCFARLKLIGEFNPGEAIPAAPRTIPLTLGGKKVHLRISFFPSEEGMSAVVSFTGVGERTLEELGELERKPPVAEFLNLLHREDGLFVLIEKRRYNLALLADLIFQDAVSEKIKTIIISSEEPAGEGDHLMIKVEERTDRDYARALRRAVGQKPDLLYLDYLEGADTLELVFQLALAGSSILGRSSFSRPRDFYAYLLECGFKNSQITAALRCLLVIRPVRVLCPQCKRSREISDGEKKRYRFLRDPGWKELFEPVGCPSCRNTGYRGMTWLFESIKLTPERKKFLLRTKSSWELRENWLEKMEGGIYQAARNFLREGKIDLAEFELLNE